MELLLRLGGSVLWDGMRIEWPPEEKDEKGISRANKISNQSMTN
jgi:hypothetical protein